MNKSISFSKRVNTSKQNNRFDSSSDSRDTSSSSNSSSTSSSTKKMTNNTSSKSSTTSSSQKTSKSSSSSTVSSSQSEQQKIKTTGQYNRNQNDKDDLIRIDLTSSTSQTSTSTRYKEIHQKINKLSLNNLIVVVQVCSLAISDLFPENNCQPFPVLQRQAIMTVLHHQLRLLHH